jgi:hypothetical protein
MTKVPIMISVERNVNEWLERRAKAMTRWGKRYNRQEVIHDLIEQAMKWCVD